MGAKKLFFVFVLIMLMSLTLKQKFFWILFVLTRLVRMISMKTKEQLLRLPFINTVYSSATFSSISCHWFWLFAGSYFSLNQAIVDTVLELYIFLIIVLFFVFVFFFLSGRIINIFTKSSPGKLSKDLDIMLTVGKFYRWTAIPKETSFLNKKKKCLNRIFKPLLRVR